MKLNLKSISLRLFKLMLIISLLSGVSNQSKAQLVLIPDTNFRNALIAQGLGSCITGNYIDSTCVLVQNDTLLNLSNSNISDLTGIIAFKNISTLRCDYCHLTFLPILPDSITFLSIVGNQLTSLPLLPNRLSTLYCSTNLLTSLPQLPSTLLILNCESNRLNSLPGLPVSLTSLNCSVNLLTSLPLLPSSLIGIDCSANSLSSLPSLPNTLISLWCTNNLLTSLPSLPSSISELNLYRNHLTSLPVLPASLVTFSCADNFLTSLPSLPGLLSLIVCAINQLSTLPALPNSLGILNCGNNQLTSLPVLPNLLYDLNCSFNNLTSLPLLPGSIQQLNCSNNLLTVIPSIPDYLISFNCSNNINLSCLPKLGTIQNLKFLGTNITCLPNYGDISVSNPSLSTVILCDFNNANACVVNWNISGQTFFDADTNCTYSIVDTTQENLKLNLFKNGNLIQQTYSGAEGFYSFDTDSVGVYTVKIDTLNIPFEVSCPSSLQYIDSITVNDSLKYNNDFAFKCKLGFDLAASQIHARAFVPSKITSINIYAGDYSNLFGAHCAAGISGVVKIILSPHISYIYPAANALIPNISGDTLIYNIPDFAAIIYNEAFNFFVQTNTTAVLGSTISISVNVTPTNDNNPSNNFLTQSFVVIGSFDPNKKTAYPQNSLDINGDHWLTYTIDFQNTGTAPAENIYITDTLDANLDLATFTLTGYSNQPFVQVINNVAKFNFPNINLPDSLSNEPESHGYVQYKIKSKPNLVVGDKIKNTANIYFDFNAPVITNTTTNEMIAVGLNELGRDNNLSIYPNPTHDQLYIKTGSGITITALRIYDLEGRILLLEEMKKDLTINIANLTAGVYLLDVTGLKNGKFFKEVIKVIKN